MEPTHEFAILVVEDDVSTQLYFQGYFDVYAEKAEVLIADSFVDAKRLVEACKLPIPFALVDGRLRESRGEEVVTFLRQKFTESEMLIIAISSSADHNEIMRTHGATISTRGKYEVSKAVIAILRERNLL